jgi:uncharacterized protein YneF (UPF0154 family)
MKFPQQHITKLTLTITKTIVVSVVFIIGVIIGVINILSKQMENKVNAKTRITSDQSKIVPKNTKKEKNIVDSFGPDRSVKR